MVTTELELQYNFTERLLILDFLIQNPENTTSKHEVTATKHTNEWKNKICSRHLRAPVPLSLLWNDRVQGLAQVNRSLIAHLFFSSRQFSSLARRAAAIYHLRLCFIKSELLDLFTLSSTPYAFLFTLISSFLLSVTLHFTLVCSFSFIYCFLERCRRR